MNIRLDALNGMTGYGLVRQLERATGKKIRYRRTKLQNFVRIGNVQEATHRFLNHARCESSHLADFQISNTKIRKAREIQQSRVLGEIRKIISRSGYPGNVKRKARLFFRLLAQAEARVHHTTPLQVHLHEVGRKENIYRTLAVFDFLGKERIRIAGCTRINVGCGRVKTAHGMLEVPAPATRELLRGFRTFRKGRGEKTTPSGAAWIRLFVHRPFHNL